MKEGKLPNPRVQVINYRKPRNYDKEPKLPEINSITILYFNLAA